MNQETNKASVNDTASKNHVIYPAKWEEGKPLVTVIAVCHNHAPYLVETLESIRLQTYPNIELVIINNLKDECEEIVLTWIEQNQANCRFIQNDKPKNISQNLNKGLALAIGDFIQVISTDDILMHEKIEKQVAILQSNAYYSAVFTNAEIIDKESKLLGKKFQEEKYLQDAYINNRFVEAILKHCFVPHHSVLFRRNVFERVGYYDDTLIIEDWDFFIRYFKSGERMYYINTPLVFYRKIGNSLWSNKKYIVLESEFSIMKKHGLFAYPMTVYTHLEFFKKMDLVEYWKGMKLLVMNKEAKWLFTFLALRIGIPKSIILFIQNSIINKALT